MKPQFLDHLVIVVKDIQKTTKFYTNFLGEPEYIDNNQVVFKIGETKMFFGLPYKDYIWHDKDKYGLNHIAFGAKSLGGLKKFEKTLNNSGIRNSGIKIDKYGKKEFIWFDDPDGYRLEFYCRNK